MSAYPGQGLSTDELLFALGKNLEHKLARPNPPFDLAEVNALEKSLSEISAKIRAMRNALVPVNRLPVEILQQIPPWLPHAWDIVVASHVCCHWRTAFLSYPDLWTFLGCKAEHATHPFLKMSQLIVTQKDHSGEGSPSPGYGTWKDGNHIIGRRNDRLERELFGEPSNYPKQRTGTDLEMRGHFSVEATGSGIPGPIATFVDSLLDPLLLENISYARYDTPSPIQRYSIPIVAAGRDLLSHAQTGLGETTDFLFPILSASFSQGPRPLPADADAPSNAHSRKAYPTTLILAPTRELVRQIHDEARKYAYRSWVRPVVVYGGADIKAQVRQIELGCDLLSATPGRLVDLIERGHVSLANVRYFVIDGTDRILGMGFERQIRRIAQEEDMPGAHDRQTLMFSATLPRDIQVIAKDFLEDYILLSPGGVPPTSENITQKVEYVEDRDKRSVLLDTLAVQPQGELTLVFVETKRLADILSNYLIANNYSATSIHGDRTRREREVALQTFRQGRTPVMVATAVATRGHDMPGVAHVINYDLPSHIDDYVHRIGRAGNTGISTTFFNRGNKNIARDLVEFLRKANQEPPDWLETIVYESTLGNGGGGGSRGRGGRGRGVSRDYRSASGSGVRGGGGRHASGGGG